MKKEIHLIDGNVIKMAFKALIIKSTRPKPKGTNLKLYDKFTKLYDSDYSKLNYKEKLDSYNLSQILGYMATDMVTNIENNIKRDFMSYVRRIVNSSFIKEHNEQLEKSKNNKDM